MSDEFDEIHTRIAQAFATNALTDQLLNLCDDMECSICAVIVCPHAEPLHFHHDGCPACEFDPPPERDSG
jgi:hypothetical protein